MQLVKPSFNITTFLNGDQILKDIERVGRIAYKSEDKITALSAKDFVKMIVKRNHGAVLEFGSSITVHFTLDRGVSHELVRHRLASFLQESTRFCNYSKDKFGNNVTFIIPDCFKDIKEGVYETFSDDLKYTSKLWMHVMLEADRTYLQLIKQGMSPQYARSVLPNSLKTEIFVKANIREWRHILQLRTAHAAHPQMRQLMVPLLKEFKLKIPIIFEDII